MTKYTRVSRWSWGFWNLGLFMPCIFNVAGRSTCEQGSSGRGYASWLAFKNDSGAASNASHQTIHLESSRNSLADLN